MQYVFGTVYVESSKFMASLTMWYFKHLLLPQLSLDLIELMWWKLWVDSLLEEHLSSLIVIVSHQRLASNYRTRNKSFVFAKVTINIFVNTESEARRFSCGFNFTTFLYNWRSFCCSVYLCVRWRILSPNKERRYFDVWYLV